MISKLNNRQVVLSGSLAMTLIAVGWASRFENSDAAVTIEPTAKKAVPAHKPALRETGNETRPTESTNIMRYADSVTDIFATPAVPHSAPLPPVAEFVAPSAPPLPFTYMGRMIEDGKETLFLATPNQNYVVHVGDVVNGQYRIDGIENSHVTFTYLPLTVNQTLAIGEVQ